MDELFTTKMSRCRHYFGNLISCTEIEHQCRKQEYKKIDETECDNCPMYKSMFIEYPIEVTKIDQKPIDYQDCLYKSYIGKPVKVRVGQKTYLGVFLGELPTSAHIQHNEQSGVLTVNHMTNPAMFVPELNRIVFGHESWWSVLESTDDFKEITDQDIKNVWYVQLAKSLMQQPEEGKEAK
jgi:hypothetical protein